jgi:hypothetical protein
MGRTREVSKILSSNTLLATDAELAAVESSLGLTHINTSTFSAATGHSVNNIFNSTFRNYRLIFEISQSAIATVGIRFNTISGDDNGNVYNFQRFFTGSTSSVFARTQNASAWNIIAGSTDPGIHKGEILIQRPNIAANTFIQQNLTYSVTAPEINVQQGGINNSTQYTGFSLIVNTGTITGVLNIYGYKD